MIYGGQIERTEKDRESEREIEEEQSDRERSTEAETYKEWNTNNCRKTFIVNQLKIIKIKIKKLRMCWRTIGYLTYLNFKSILKTKILKLTSNGRALPKANKAEKATTINLTWKTFILKW
jgi:hypothetical protein